MTFLKSSLSFAWLEFKAIKFYPSSLVLSVIKSFVGTGIWFFVALFLKDYARTALSDYGGNYVAYMVIGVVFFQNSGNIMNLQFQSLSTAYWDKRLEIYNTSPNGIWAFITGRFIWTFLYDLVIQGAVLLVAVQVAGVEFSARVPVIPALTFYLLFVLTSFGIGMAGASTFFSLQVKQGKEPITWLTDILARIFSGVYYPLAVIPANIRPVSRILPHTYALEGIRLIMINGQTFANAEIRKDCLVLLLFCILALAGGMRMLSRAMVKAERGNGVGMVV